MCLCTTVSTYLNWHCWNNEIVSIYFVNLQVNENFLIARSSTRAVRSHTQTSRSPSSWSDDRCSTSSIYSSRVCCSQPSGWWRSACRQRAERKSALPSQYCSLWLSSCLSLWRISRPPPKWFHSSVSTRMTEHHTLRLEFCMPRHINLKTNFTNEIFTTIVITLKFSDCQKCVTLFGHYVIWCPIKIHRFLTFFLRKRNMLWHINVKWYYHGFSRSMDFVQYSVSGNEHCN